MFIKKIFGKGSSSNEQIARADTTYQQLLELARRDLDEVDFNELRLAYAALQDYDPHHLKHDTRLAIKKFSEAVEQDKPDLIINAGNEVLSIEPMYIWAHVHISLNCEKLGRIEKADYHKKFVNRWMDSINQSGDGLSYQTAFKVVNINEEYSMLALLRAEIEDRHSVEWKGHFFDIFEVRNPESSERTVFHFNIDLIVKGFEEGRAYSPSDSEMMDVLE